MTCSVEVCGRKARARGLCHAHYERLARANYDYEEADLDTAIGKSKKWWGLSAFDSPAEKSPSMKEIYWAAGIFEGEGYCGLRKSSPRVTVTQAGSGELAERLKLLFGGNVNGPYQGSRPEQSDYWKWTINGPRALGFLQTIYSLLVTTKKREQVMNTFRGSLEVNDA